MNETAANAGNRGPTKANPVPADEIKKFLIKSFPTNAKVYSFYSCQAGKCVTVCKEDQQRMKGRDRFQHQWILDTTFSYCEKPAITGSSFKTEKECSALYAENMTLSIHKTKVRNSTQALHKI